MASSIFADSGGNPFDQELNTTDEVTFADVEINGEFEAESGRVNGDLSIDGNVRLLDGATIRPDDGTGEAYTFQVYDTNGAAFRTYLTATNGDAPAVAIGIPTSGTLEVQASTYKSSDGSTGATGSANAANTLTIKNGLVTVIA